MPPPEADSCPVDHNTRERWLAAAKARGQQAPAHPTTHKPPAARVPAAPAVRYSLDAGLWVPLVRRSSSQPRQPKLMRLDGSREISTIPRAQPTSTDVPLNTAEIAALPANSERDTGHDRQSGNWIYPSQEMFFSAMKRKGHEANPTDMASIVPIHNAVNERAWAEIKTWEAGLGSEKCGGPKLMSFSGDSKALTPRARWNILMGYHPPFDRHDWVVDRCGKKVDYVIDFYSGKGSEGLQGLNFHLDVRPKLNSWEGIRMRVAKTFGG